MKPESEDSNDDKNLSIQSARPSLLSKVSPAKARRTVSFRDKCSNQSLETVHHIESLKHYNLTEEKGFSCLKCSIQ